jgi:glucokinase
MALLGIDLGGTKVAFAIFDIEGIMLARDSYLIGRRKGKEVGKLITGNISKILRRVDLSGEKVEVIGVSVPGISHSETNTVWAPNITGWKEYPLLADISNVSGDIPVTIDSDRACSIFGELWQGNAKGCNDAIFLTVGTGIGAGILTNGKILRGAHDIAGAVGWMALERPFREKFISCGCFEYYSSGTGLARNAEIMAGQLKNYEGTFKRKKDGDITSHEVFSAYEEKDPIAVKIINQSVKFWGMAIANLVSIFNPEKIILGGGVFGPAKVLIPRIRSEAEKWAQPLSMKHVSIEVTALAGDAAVYGAGYLALRKIREVRGET